MSPGAAPSAEALVAASAQVASPNAEDDDPRHRGRGARGGRAVPRTARERRARGTARRHRHVGARRSAGTSRTRSISCRPAPTQATPTRCSRSSSARMSTSCCRSRRTISRTSPRRASAFPCRARRRGRDGAALERQGRDVRAAAADRRARAGVPARDGRCRRRGGGEGARLSRPSRLLQAGVLVGVSRLPRPRPDGRPRAPAALRAPGRGGDAARGSRRAAARRTASTCS